MGKDEGCIYILLHIHLSRPSPLKNQVEELPGEGRHQKCTERNSFRYPTDMLLSVLRPRRQEKWEKWQSSGHLCILLTMPLPQIQGLEKQLSSPTERCRLMRKQVLQDLFLLFITHIYFAHSSFYLILSTWNLERTVMSKSQTKDYSTVNMLKS